MLIRVLLKTVLVFSLINYLSFIVYLSIDIFIFGNGDILKWGSLWGTFIIGNWFSLFIVIANSIGHILFQIIILRKRTTQKYKIAVLSGLGCIFPIIITSGNFNWPNWISFSFKFGDVLGLIIGWGIVAFFISILMYLLLKFWYKIFKDKYMKDIIFLFAYLIIGSGCSNETELSLNTKMLGKSIEEVSKELNINLSDFGLIHESPGIVRGLSNVKSQNNIVFLYIDRNTFEFDSLMIIKNKDLLNKEVVGIAVKNKNNWITVGKVIDYYHINNGE